MDRKSRPEEMGFPPHASVIEVGPRDGLQSEPDFVPTEEKIALVNGLIDAGIRHLEVTSFVSPRAVPQMRDASEVLSGIDRTRGAVLTALVPNARAQETLYEHDLGVVRLRRALAASARHQMPARNSSPVTA